MVFFIEYSKSYEEFDREEEDIGLILLMHKKRRPKHGGSVWGREFEGKESMRTTSSCSTILLSTRCIFREILSSQVSDVY
jgi:hypothetical protein